MTVRLAHDGLDETLRAVLDLLRERDLYGVLRLEDRRSRGVAVEGTRVDSLESSVSAGLGVQAFTRSGHTGFSAIDDPDPRRALEAGRRAAAAALAAERAGLFANPAILSAPPSRGRAVPPLPPAARDLTPDAMRDLTLAFAREAVRDAGDVAVRTNFAMVRSDWRIVRSDGTDVSFRVPRSMASVLLTAKRDGDAARTSASAAGVGSEVLLDSGLRGALLRRVADAAGLARALLVAPAYPAGCYPILIDYALAKGLAHEAFGHAAESDGLLASILGREGRFRAGEAFGGPNVTIVDESIEGDNAYQPFSGNGGPRRRAVILERGVLRDALTDDHTAGRAGTPVTGAERLASFADVPVPRMSNIRMEVADPFPVAGAGDFHDLGPERVRDLLVAAGDLPPGGRVVYLSGYRGGQVNPALGDFVFHSTALYELRPESVTLFKPGIFSGRIEDALHAIRRGYGPLRLDAAGTCGKAGQGVPSSGGSHWFVLIGETANVRIGGRA